VNLFAEALAWLFSPDRLTDSLPLPLAIGQHLFYTFLSVLIASAIAVPLGWRIGHTGRCREIAVGISGAARAIPSFGLLLLLVLVLGVLNKPAAAVIAFVLLAIPSLLAGAYSGLEVIDRQVLGAARAMGMTEWQVFRRVEVPLGLPLLIGGLRSATLQVVATVVLAAYANLGGLGHYIIQGINLRRFEMVLGSAIAIIALALLLDGLFALLQRFVVPRGVTAGRTRELRETSSRRRAVVETPTV
jgi:osmoprotectant transport system permease protein